MTTIPPFQLSVSRRGFTLIELLIVIAIIGLLGAATTIFLPSVLGARSLSASTDEVANYLNIARSTAMGQNTFVIVGFFPTQANGTDDLQMVGFRSLNGAYSQNFTTATITTGNTPSGYYLPITKVVHLPNVQLTPITSGNLPSNVTTKLSNDNISVGTNLSSGSTTGLTVVDVNKSGANKLTSSSNLNISSSAGTASFTSAVILFTPQGEAIPINGTPPTYAVLANEPFPQGIAIGLVQSHGGQVAKSKQAQGSVIVLDGGSGKVSEYRP